MNHGWKRPRRVALILLVNLATVAALVGIAELICSRFVDTVGANLVPDERLNHTWKPGGSALHDDFVTQNPEFPEPYLHVYNEHGWLETYDVSKEKAPDTYRIFYVGDSFTEGTCPMDSSVPSLVEQALNGFAEGKGLHFEVINTGTSSYSPTLHYLLVRYVLLDHAPDLIVVNVDMTDDFDDWKYARTLILDEQGDPWACPPRDPGDDPVDPAAGRGIAQRLRIILARHSHAYNLMERVRQSRAEQEDPRQALVPVVEGRYPRWAWCAPTWSPATEIEVRRTLALIRRLAVLCRERGVKVVFTSVPHYWQYNGKADGTGPPAWSSRPHEEIARVCAEAEVPYLDSFRALAAQIQDRPRSQWYYADDIHFNPRGYRLWAQAHLAFLGDRENGLLPESMFRASP